MRLASIMTSNPLCVRPDTALYDALSIMDNAYVRHLPVVSDAGRLVGVVSDRDLLKAAGWPRSIEADTGQARRQRPTTVGDVMAQPVITGAPDETLVRAVVDLAGRRIGCLPVVKNGVLVGIVSETDIVGAFAHLVGRDAKSDSNPYIAHLMTWHPTTIAWDATLAEARRLMSVNEIRHLPVLQQGVLAGIVSDRDLRRANGSGRCKDTPVEEVMARNVVTLTTDATARDAALALVRERISAVPIVAEAPPLSLVGIITISDLLEHCLSVLSEPTANSIG